MEKMKEPYETKHNMLKFFSLLPYKRDEAIEFYNEKLNKNPLLQESAEVCRIVENWKWLVMEVLSNIS